MSGLATPMPAGPQIKGIAVCWGLAGGPKFTGHLQQSASLDDEYQTTERYQDTTGITASYVFNDAMTKGNVELIVAEGVPLPAPSEFIVETDTGQKFLIITRGREYTNNGVTRCRYTLERGEGALFA